MADTTTPSGPRWLRGLTWLLATVLAAGCQIVPKAAPPAAVHDLGPSSGPAAPTRRAAGPARPALAVSVAAPNWMTGELHYRFLFSDATELKSYTQHRWISPPARLLEEALKQAAADPGARSPTSGTLPELRVEVERFEQQFSAPDRARAVVGLEAVLEGPSGRVAGPRRFEVTRPAPASVDGAVAALAAAGRQVADQVVAWAARELAAAPRTPAAE